MCAGPFPTALERRLLTLGEQTGIAPVRLRKLVALDRLMAVAPDRWIMKCPAALHFRVGHQFRSTRDLHLGRHDDGQAATADFRLARSDDLGDYFRFAIERTAKLDAALEGAAVRYCVSAHLAGRRFEEVTVDTGFSDPLMVEPERLRGPDLLGSAPPSSATARSFRYSID